MNINWYIYIIIYQDNIMVKLQIDLSEEEDKIVEVHKAENRLDTKESTVKKIIRESQGCNHRFELLDKKGDVMKTITQRCVNCGVIRIDKIYSSGDIETKFSKK